MYLDHCEMVKLTFSHVVMLHGRGRCINKEHFPLKKNQILFASLEIKNQYMYYTYIFYRQKDVTTKIK